MDDDEGGSPPEREYRGSMYKDRIVPEEEALTFSDPQSWRSFGISFRLVHTIENQVCRGGKSLSSGVTRHAEQCKSLPAFCNDDLGFRVAHDVKGE